MSKSKQFLLLAVLFLVIFTTGCGSAKANESSVENESKARGEYIDGTYEGTSDVGIHPGLKVSVVVKNGFISEVNIIEHSETQGVGTAAIEKLPVKIVEAQSAEVDSVTGATLSSNAIKEAVGKALAQAK